MRDSFESVEHAIDVVTTELQTLSSIGPHFRIVHRFREPGTSCAPGEEIAAVQLINHGREFLVPLPITLLLIFDFLARHARIAQNASQIAAAMRTDPFYHAHGANAAAPSLLRRKISRSCVKEYVKRMRLALYRTFRDAGLQINPQAVLLSQGTVSNHVGYRMKATFEWFHFEGINTKGMLRTGVDQGLE